MDSLKFIFGVAVLLLCMGAIGILIWIMLFGVPQGNINGGTLVYGIWNTIKAMEKGGCLL